MKKKILSVIICAAAILSLTACGKSEDPLGGLSNQNESNSTSSTSSTPASSSTQTSSKPASTAQVSSTPEQSSAPESKPEESSVPENKNEVDWDSVPYADELDFEVEDIDGGVKITNYLGLDTVVKIPETIDGKKVVAVSGFNNKVTHVKLPDSVSNIKFSGCESLVNVNIPSSLSTISEWAFFGCTGLTSIEIPNTVTEIEASAFERSGLESLTVPDSVKVFNGTMIQRCANLKEVRLPKDIHVAVAFYSFGYENACVSLDGCSSLTNTDFLKNVKPSDAESDFPFAVSFGDCSSLTSITYPEGVECIVTFGGCTSLTEITIPNSVTRVGDTDGKSGTLAVGGFGSNNPKKITLSDNLETLSEIKDCPQDTEIVYKGKTYKSNQLPNLYKAVNGN